MPRLTASRAISLSAVTGKLLSCKRLQVIATPEQICSGVNVPGAPGRGASVNRGAPDSGSHARCRIGCDDWWLTVAD
jgi:hypothetical protein